MEKKCPNCNSVIVNSDITPHLVEVFELFYGSTWDSEIQDIAMEVCSVCGTLPELLEYLEKQLSLGKTKNFMNIIEEFDDNLHVPFLLQIAAPIFIFIVDNSTSTVQKAAIDELGVYGDEDSVGRFILAHQDENVRILGLRALEKIAKHWRKQGKKLEWPEFIDYLVGDDVELITKIRKKIKVKGFLQESTIEIIVQILETKEEKLVPKTAVK